MATFVIVHGAWGGGWEWSPVADVLRDRGHRVFTPTLSGLGDRAHVIAMTPVDMSTHIADVVNVLRFEQLRDVVLCGASYGGIPATGAADLTPDKVRLLVYVDGLVPVNGMSALDLLPEDFAEAVRAGLAEHGPRWSVPMPRTLFDALISRAVVPATVRDGYYDRVRDHPAAAFAEPIHLTGSVNQVPKAFVHCTVKAGLEEYGGDPVAASAMRARQERWTFIELPVPHDPQILDAQQVASVLEQLAE